LTPSSSAGRRTRFWGRTGQGVSGGRRVRPALPELFQREAERVRGALDGRALPIEHDGSTAVAGLCAKPNIDMLLVIEDSADEPSYVPALEAAGYKLLVGEPAWFEHCICKGPDTEVNLHVFSAGTSEIDAMLLFCEADREKYAAAKGRLAKKKWSHVQHYADAKTSIAREIMERATRGMLQR
jgi:GrpB-like predicted nucleotidyltransferase (UPF0157 family)